jgi:hypothetical protein
MPGPTNNKTPKTNGNGLDAPALESWLWDAACTIRGPLDAPKFKDYILPLIFLKRLSDGRLALWWSGGCRWGGVGRCG